MTVRVTVERGLIHQCPYVEEIDKGAITVSWDGDTVELHALSAFLDSWENRAVTHEALTCAIADYVHEHGGSDVQVTSVWSTAGFRVEVTA